MHPQPKLMLRMQFSKYALAGGIATCIHYLVLFVLVEQWMLAPHLAAGVGALAGALVGFFINDRFTFSSRSPSSIEAKSRAFVKYCAVAVFSAVCSSVIVWFGAGLLGVHYLMAQSVAVCVMFLLSYKANKTWTFQ